MSLPWWVLCSSVGDKQKQTNKQVNSKITELVHHNKCFGGNKQFNEIENNYGRTIIEGSGK